MRRGNYYHFIHFLIHSYVWGTQVAFQSFFSSVSCLGNSSNNENGIKNHSNGNEILLISGFRLIYKLMYFDSHEESCF